MLKTQIFSLQAEWPPGVLATCYGLDSVCSLKVCVLKMLVPNVKVLRGSGVFKRWGVIRGY